MSQRRVNRSREEREDISALTNDIQECVRYILCREGSKIPIKRADIAKHLKGIFGTIGSICQTASNQINIVITEADKSLQRIYGYKLEKLDGNDKIIAALHKPCESEMPPTINPEHRKLLTAVLMHIYMSGSAIKEDEMWRFLTEAGLLQDDDKINRALIKNTFTKQMYLQYYKEGEGENTKLMFDWGPRATKEIPKLFLLNKMAQAFEKTPDEWSEHYREATAEAQNETVQL